MSSIYHSATLYGPEPVIPSYQELPPWYAVPDFVAGFLYEASGQNFQKELESCMTDTTKLYNYGLAFFNDISAFRWKAAANDALYFYWFFPDVTYFCTDLKLRATIDEIYDWAQIFTDPAVAVDHAGKKYLLHKKQVD